MQRDLTPQVHITEDTQKAYKQARMDIHMFMQSYTCLKGQYPENASVRDIQPPHKMNKSI